MTRAIAGCVAGQWAALRWLLAAICAGFRAPRLAVVPYGDGELILNRERASAGSAEVTEHFFRGEERMSVVQFQNGQFRLRLRERSESGAILEWIEVAFPS